MIAVAYFAILSAGLPTVLNRPSAEIGLALTGWVLLASPWVLGGLVWTFDRDGPQRSWTVTVMLFAFYPFLTLFIDLSVLTNAVQTGVIPRVWIIEAMNASALVSFLTF